MSDHRFLLQHRAQVAYSVLTAAEKAAVVKALASLARRPPERWPAKGVVRLASPEPLYFVKVDDSLRAFVRPAAEGRPEVVDVVRQETLDFLKAAGNGPAAR
jgi:hypothetical protein